MTLTLSGKIAIVTGAAQGIGKACALALGCAGATVVMSDLNGDGVSRAASQLMAESGAAMNATQVDVSDPSQCRALIADAVRQYGQVDLLINCAAAVFIVPALESDPTIWERTFAVGVYGAFYCAQAFAQAIIARHGEGSIVNISSITATHSAYGRVAYGASKAALNSMTRSLALEWAPHRIRVNAIAPSHTATERLRQVFAPGNSERDAIIQRIPLGRFAEPSEIADAVIFLCLDQARFITGQVLAVDGGYTANGGWRSLIPPHVDEALID